MSSAGSPDPPILRLGHVSATYERRRRFLRGSRDRSARMALIDASISVGQGEVVGLIGESGSGKTTTGRVVAGLLPASSGQVELAGEPVGVLRTRTLRQKHLIQMVFQDPYSSLNPHMSAGEAVAEVHRHRLGASKSEADDLARESLIEVGLPPSTFGSRPKRLSGGQRQRVSIARALAGKPALLLADELTSALDASIRHRIINLLRTLSVKRNLAILMITHDISNLAGFTDRVIVMKDGHIVEEGSTQAILQAPTHPYTQQLVASVPRLPEISVANLAPLMRPGTIHAKGAL